MRFLEALDLYQLFNLMIATITNILSFYLVVTMGYWTHRLRFTRSNLRPLIFSLGIAKLAVWFWSLSNIIEIISNDVDPPIGTLPARIFFMIAVVIQSYVTTRVKPAPRMTTVDLAVELNIGGRIILIVEDNEPLARLYRFTLERAGFNAEFVSSGKDALTIIEQEKPCLMIVDFSLPDMDGVELVLQARKLGYSGAVVAISGAANLLDEDKLAPANFNQVLSKPIRAGDLVGVVSKWARS